MGIVVAHRKQPDLGFGMIFSAMMAKNQMKHQKDLKNTMTEYETERLLIAQEGFESSEALKLAQTERTQAAADKLSTEIDAITVQTEYNKTPFGRLGLAAERTQKMVSGFLDVAKEVASSDDPALKVQGKSMLQGLADFTSNLYEGAFAGSEKIKDGIRKLKDIDYIDLAFKGFENALGFTDSAGKKAGSEVLDNLGALRMLAVRSETGLSEGQRDLATVLSEGLDSPTKAQAGAFDVDVPGQLFGMDEDIRDLSNMEIATYLKSDEGKMVLNDFSAWTKLSINLLNRGMGEFITPAPDIISDLELEQKTIESLKPTADEVRQIKILKTRNIPDDRIYEAILESRDADTR